MDSSKKKILLIAPLFFGYYKEIKKTAEEMGYDVVYICDAPSNSNVSKAMGRINKNLIKRSTEKYFRGQVLKTIDKLQFDYILVIGGMTFAFTADMIGTIRDMNKNAEFILYQWDSEKNLPYSKGIHKYFDRIYSFDLNDCNEKKLYRFLPLFYTKMYESIGANTKETFKYDCSYIGTAHPQKFKDINEMSDALKNIMSKQFIYHYMPSKLKYIYHKLLSKEYKKAKYKDFESKKLSFDEVMNVLMESRCILDAPQAGQTGLTIRTIECLGAKRKLITTNKDVKKYDFYNPRNIYVYDGEIDPNNEFFENDYEEVDEKIYKKYSLVNWISYMLNNEGE